MAEDALPLHEVMTTLARLEGKLDVAVQRHDDRLAGHSRAITDHEARIRALEGIAAHAMTTEAYTALESVRNEAASRRRTQTVAVVSVVAMVVMPLLVAAGNWISSHL